jgi:hypothetical protein
MRMNTENVRELRAMMVSLRDNPLLDEQGHPVKFNMAIWNDKKTCGTSACAAGHMPYWPAFRNAGWKATEYGDILLNGEEVEEAGEEFFGTNLIYRHIFMGSYTDEDGEGIDLESVTVSMVIDRIDAILAGQTQFYR